MTNSLLCVGLDSDFKKLPEKFKSVQFPQFEFNKWIIEETHEYVGSYKPNTAFYEARGEQGWKELTMTVQYIKKNYPDIFVIADAKRADIGSTNEGYVTAIFDTLGADAITVHPYLGQEALQPFLARKDKTSIILCRTSNPGAGEIQDLLVQSDSSNHTTIRALSEAKPLWWHVAKKVSTQWNINNNCMLVVGATYPEEMKQIRDLVGDMPILVPGVGAQGGSVEEVMKAGLNSQKAGLYISSSRGIIFAENPRAEAKKLFEEIESYR